MKRYEKMGMSTEEALSAVASSLNSAERVADYLLAEIEAKPRWETIKSNEDLDSLFNEFVSTTTMPYSAFVSWLKEEVEE